VGDVLMALLIVPFVASAAAFVLPPAIGRVLGVAAGAISLGLASALVGRTPVVTAAGWVRVDDLSLVFLLLVSFLYLMVMVFALGYVEHAEGASSAVYERRLFAGLNLFCAAMLVAPAVSSLGLVWVAIEVTTVVSALLVAIDDTSLAAEAAWKYVIIASMGLGIALLATIVLYAGAALSLRSGTDLFYPSLIRSAAHLSPEIARVAFVLATLGFGTKVGFFPVHTWLPDAHSEAPTPVSALLSAALLAISFYAILRYFEIAARSAGPAFPREVLFAFGVASLGLAAFSLLRQRDLKRMLAYSSVEHMGIVAIGMSFSAPLALVGVLLQILSHGTAKATAFAGAGSVLRKYRTKDLRRLAGGIGALPWSGPLFVLAVLGLSGLPPFGVFRSEFLIVAGGLSDPHDAAVAVLVALVVIAFFGLAWHVGRAMLSPDAELSPDADGIRPGEPSRWIVLSMLLGLLALLLLGVDPPAPLAHLLLGAAHELAVPGH